MDSRARRFTGLLAEFLRLRDHICRTISAPNGQGLCESCNHAEQAPGWHARPRPGPRHTIETTTPTGHRYRSLAPPLHLIDPIDPVARRGAPRVRVDITHGPLLRVA